MAEKVLTDSEVLKIVYNSDESFSDSSSDSVRQKHGPTVESDYSRHPQNSSCSTGTFKTLVFFVDICCGLKTSSPVQN